MDISSILFLVYINFISLNLKKLGRKEVVVESLLLLAFQPKERHYLVTVVLDGIVVTLIMQMENDEGPRKSSTFHEMSIDKKKSENLSPVHELIILIHNKRKMTP